ncbi:hypothetical protein J3P71_03995 [Rhizobium leguminosarum]|uniref:hypothetical protein n=1 Tax=Rhizobium leguminosarum TaxID=384 RepID=UPI001441CB64|nr:hypothetical protein [Rhizobium leguminosarum]MBY5841426.1 hypothetical protein [Rhizobium leguminosarum]NKM81421.1 hypothetical protein [Rhizobium leguminosarum bv. viciae]QSZ08949.1 hypothetical protein J3P71_03995 [Rhizobium leguminosarum]
MKWPYHSKLKCQVKSLSYDFKTRTGTLLMAEINACDAMGCWEIFSAIDPDVKRIETFAGDKADTFYIRSGKEWGVQRPSS